MDFTNIVLSKYGFKPKSLTIQMPDGKTETVYGYFIDEHVNRSLLRLLPFFELYELKEDEDGEIQFDTIQCEVDLNFSGTFATTTMLPLTYSTAPLKIIADGEGLDRSTLEYENIKYPCVILPSPFEDNKGETITIAAESLWDYIADNVMDERPSAVKIDESIYAYIPDELFQKNNDVIVEYIINNLD